MLANSFIDSKIVIHSYPVDGVLKQTGVTVLVAIAFFIAILITDFTITTEYVVILLLCYISRLDNFDHKKYAIVNYRLL